MKLLSEYDWNKLFSRRYSLRYIRQYPLLMGLVMAIDIIASVYLVVFGQIYFYYWCGGHPVSVRQWLQVLFSFLIALAINRLLGMV
jgi:hypothetical protein